MPDHKDYKQRVETILKDNVLRVRGFATPEALEPVVITEILNLISEASKEAGDAAYLQATKDGAEAKMERLEEIGIRKRKGEKSE